MSSQYTIVQYVPNTIADERINIGLIAWQGSYIRCRFLRDWRRIRSFGNEDPGFLRDFARECSEALSSQRMLPGMGVEFGPGELEKMIANWKHGIVFTQPRGSLKPVDALLNDIGPLFIRERAIVARGRNRRSAANIVIKSLTEAVRERAPQEVDHFVKVNEPLGGALAKHRFDVVLANGRPRAAVHALSFQRKEIGYLQIEVDAVAWSITDVREKHRKIPMAVFLLPPVERAAEHAYRNATRLFRGLNATVADNENKIDAWAKQQVKVVMA